MKRLFCVVDFCQLYLDEKWNSVLCGKLASQFLVTKPPERDGYILYSNPMHQYAKEGNNLLVCLLAVVIRVSACASQKLSKYPWIFVQAEASLPLQLLKTPLGVWLLLRLVFTSISLRVPFLNCFLCRGLGEWKQPSVLIWIKSIFFHWSQAQQQSKQNIFYTINRTTDKWDDVNAKHASF